MDNKKFYLLRIELFEYTRLVEVQDGNLYLDTIWQLKELKELNGAAVTVNFNGDLKFYDINTMELLKEINLMEINSFIKILNNKENKNMKDILDVLRNKYNLSAEEFNDTYKRYKWHIEKCKELFKRDNEMKIILKDNELVCPVCYNDAINGNYCSNCGQKIIR